jgi:hypothetical protein
VASIGHAGSTRKIRVHLPASLENISRLPRANDAEQHSAIIVGTVNNIYLGQMIGVGALAAV